MKYIVVLGDGMADEPLEALGGKTPLEYAQTPCMDSLASMGHMGLVQNVPSGMAPGSDVANLSVLGYDPKRSYSGRSPLEALSVGVKMESDDVIFRTNIVTLTEEEPYAEKTILDHSSGEIATKDADVLMDAIRSAFNSETVQFYTGTSYRHIMVWKKGKLVSLEPPHDHLGTQIGPWLPKEPMLREMMEESFPILNAHPMNLARAEAGKHKANSLWFWGAGTKPSLQNFEEKTGLKGAMISAVDLLKGIAVGAGMKVYQVPGATGSLDTNYEGKAQAAVKALLEDGCDFVYIHVEAPDECGHRGEMENKIKAIELIDEKILTPLTAALREAGPFRIMVLPDHPTPLSTKTHASDPVPYLIYDSAREQCSGVSCFCEETAKQTGNYVEAGPMLIEKLFSAIQA